MIDKTQKVQQSLGSTKVEKVQALDLNAMYPMERHRYITSNSKVCTCCNKEKRMTLFWNKQNNTINDNCNPCNKKLYEIEVMKIVLGVLKKDEVL